MVSNREGEGALRAAESFLREAQTGKKRSFTVTLPFQTAQILKHHFSSLIFVYRVLLGERMAGDTKGITHEDSMLSMISVKLKVALPNRYEKRVRKRKVIPSIRVALSAREVEFINSSLFYSMRVAHDDYSGLYEEEWKEQSFRTIQGKSVALIGLNLAFIQAGGEIQDDFKKFYEGFKK